MHTYPESHPEGGLCTFRADIEVSTCGVISPLNALNYLIHQLESDIVTIDYRVRGFTRDINGMKHFIDHEINSIQNFMSEDMKSLYDMMDVNVYQENIFHTKMLLKEFDLKHYMFHTKPEDLSEEERKVITDLLWKEMREFTTAVTFRPCKRDPEQGRFGKLLLFHKVAVGIHHTQEVFHAAQRQALFVVVAHPSSISSPENSSWLARTITSSPSIHRVYSCPARCRERSLPFTVSAACSTSSSSARFSSPLR